jgi:polyvinyl alcohol dehydrogenase (cytochrome)
VRSVGAAIAVTVVLSALPFGLGTTMSAMLENAPRAVSGNALVAAEPIGPSEDWTSFMNGLGHTSYQPDSDGLTATDAANLSLAWSFSTGGPIVSEPIGSDNALYFGSWDGNEYSVSASTGEIRWATYLGQSQCTAKGPASGISSTANLVNGTVYVGGGGAYWDALSAVNGSVLWKIYTGNNSTGTGGHYNWASPAIYGGNAYVGIASHCDIPLVQGQLFKVNLTTQSVVQVFNTTTPKLLGATIWSSPAINPATNTVFVATGNVEKGNNSTLDDSILALNMSSLSLTDRFQIPYDLRKPDGDFGASPTLYTGSNGVPMVADTNKNGYLYGLAQDSLSSGPVWSVHVANGDTFSSAAYSHGTLYVGSSAATLPHGTNAKGAVWAVNATTGTVLWTIPMPGTVFGPIATTSDLVVAAGGKELIVADRLNGQVLFRFYAPKIFYGGPSIADGRVYAGDNDGTLYAFSVPLSVHISIASLDPTHPKKISFEAAVEGGAQGYSYLWTFGDGATGVRPTISHNYEFKGNYSISLRVTDRASNQITVTTWVIVANPKTRFEAG